MRAVAYLACVLICLGLSGCSLFGKKKAKGGSLPSATGPGLPSPNETEMAAFADRTRPPREVGGLLAGQVLDPYNRPVPGTSVQILAPQDKDAKAAPIEVACDNYGYFLIQGLHPGQTYQLIARAKEGGQTLAGAVFVAPPRPNVIIRMSEDLATSSTPPLPGAPGPPRRPEENKDKPSDKPASIRNSGWVPGGAGASNNPGRPGAADRVVELGDPVKVDEGQRGGRAVPQAQPEVATDRIARDDLHARNAPTLNIGAPAVASSTPVPSCSLVGKQLHNFALNDLDGRPWEFRNRSGRVTLLDFWGPWCMPCLGTIPHLVTLQSRHGPSGLEVVGLTYPAGGEEVSRNFLLLVQNQSDRLRVNYRLLLGGDTPTQQCPVKTQFRVDAFPTLILINARRQEVWRHTGALDQYQVNALERLIEKELAAQ